MAADDEDRWQAFARYLHRHNARITRARRIVFDAAMARSDHFRADRLAARLARGADRVSRGTVYRTLNLMVEAGFLRRLSHGAAHAHYERAEGRPDAEHLVCEQCKTFIPFQAPEVEAAVAREAERRGFDVQSHRLTVSGLCAECAGKRGR